MDMKRWIIGSVIGVALILLGVGIYFAAKSRPALPGAQTGTKGMAQGTTATTAAGWLHTSGTKILDQNGNEFRIASINIHNFNKNAIGCTETGTVPDQQTIDNISSVGFNTVRLHINWGHLEPEAPTAGANGQLEHHWNEQYLANVDQAVSMFAQKNIKVIMAMHRGEVGDGGDTNVQGASTTKASKSAKSVGKSHKQKQTCVPGIPGWALPESITQSKAVIDCSFFLNKQESGAPEAPLDGMSEAWKNVAARYANNQNVIGFDMLNEPYPPKGNLCTAQTMNLNGAFTKIGNAIQSANPNALLVFEDSSSGAAKQGNFTLTTPPPFSNSVYSFHLYHQLSFADGKKIVDNFWSRAKQWNVPLWMAEFNAYGYQAPGSGKDQDSNWRSDTIQTLQYLKQQDISWGVSGYTGGNRIVENGQLRTDLVDAIKTGF